MRSKEAMRAMHRRAVDRDKAQNDLPVAVPTTWLELEQTGIPDAFAKLNGSRFLR